MVGAEVKIGETVAEDRQIDAISIGIGANLTGLQDQLAAAQRIVSGFDFKAPRRAKIPFTVEINTDAAERRIKTLTNPATPREIKIAATLIATQTSMAAFRKLMREQITQGGDFTIPFKADLKSAKGIKESIQQALNAAGPVTVSVAWNWAEGGPPTEGGGGTTPPSAPGGKPRKPTPKPAGPTGGNAAVTPTQPPQQPAAPAPRIITRAQRPTKARTTQDVVAPTQGGMRAARELREAQRTILPPTPGPTPAGTGGAPRPGRMPGVIPFDQRLQRGIARLMRTGDIEEFQAILGPYGASLGRSAKGYMFAPGTFLSGYNLPNRETGARDVNLAKLINEAMGYAQHPGKRVEGPLREFEEILPKEAKFKPGTIDLAMRAGDEALAFVNRARGRAASTGGVFSDLDMLIANQRRQVLNSIQARLHAEDPKTFINAFGTGRGSVQRLKNMGLGVLTSLASARFGLRSIAPPSGVLRSGKNIVESYEATLAGSALHNKQLLASENAFKNAMKRAQGADREAQRVVNPETGHVRGIPSRGLPFVRSLGWDTVESFVKYMNDAAERQEWFAKVKAGKFALGGKMRVARDFAGPPLPRANKEDLLFGLAHPRAKTDPAMANPLDNWAFRGLERDEAIEEMREHYASLVLPLRTRNALGGELGPLQRRIAAQKTEEQKRQEAKAAEEAKLPEWLRRGRQGTGVAKDLTGRALGGGLGPLARRIAIAKGELPPEPKPGETPPEPKTEPFEPLWRKLAREGKGVAKDLTRYAIGGRIERALDAVRAYAHGALPGAVAGTFGADQLKSLSGPGFKRFGQEQRGLAREILSGKPGPRSRFADDLLRQAYDPKTDTLELYRHETGQPLPGRGGQFGPTTPEEVRAALSDPRRRRMLSFSTTPPRLGMSGIPLIKARVPLSKLHASSATTGPDVFGSDFEALIRGLSMKDIEQITPGRALGGKSRKDWGKTGAYVVGEQGDEIFVPESAGWIIPHRLMDQLPKRAEGGFTRPRPVPNEAGPNETKEERDARLAANMAADRAWQKENKAALPPLSKGESYRSRAHTFWKEEEEKENARIAAIEAAKASASRKQRPTRARGGAKADLSQRLIQDNPTLAQAIQIAKEQAPTPGTTGAFEGERKLPKFEPTRLEQAQANLVAVEETLQAAELRAFTRAGMRERIAGLPQRAPGVALGQMAANAPLLGGRGSILEAQQLSQLALSQSAAFDASRKSLIVERELSEKRIQAAKDAGFEGNALEELIKDHKDITDTIEFENKNMMVTQGVADAYAKKIGGLGQIFRVFSSNLTGVIGGTLLMSTAFGSVQTALGALSPVAANFIDEQTGLRATATRVTSTLGAQTVAQHGNAQAVLATTEAEAGLNKQAAEYVSLSLQQTTRVKAGALAQQQASDLFRAATGQGGRAPEGLYGGFGGLLGTSFLAQQLGGGKGFSETVSGDLRALLNAGGAAIQIPAPTKYGLPPGAQQAAQEKTQQEILAAQTPGGPVEEYLKNLNDNIRKLGGSAEYVFTTSEDQRKAGRAVADAVGDTAGAAAALKGFIITVNGAVVSTKEYTKAVEQAAMGASMPSSDVVREALTRQREITQGTIQAQLEHQLSTVLPQQAALNFYGQPPLRPGVGIIPPSGAAGFGGFSPTAPYNQQGFNKFKQFAKDAYDDISSYAAAGLTKLYKAGVPQDLIQRYTDLGQSINEIQTSIANEQAVASAVEYNHQLYITNRSLRDARGLVGDIGTQQGTNLGALERENFLLGRRSQLLSLELNQRQINFQVAQAGFTAPGLTAEERTARIALAKYQASIAQQQQNIAVSQYGVAGQVFTETASRQLTDLKFALADLQQQHKIEIDTKAAQQAIELMTKDLSNVGDQIGAYLGKQEAAFSSMVSESATIAATATGEAFSAILTGVNSAWQSFQKIVQGYGYTPPTNQAPKSTGGKKRAEGYIGTASVPTTVTYGEAGSETIAIIRSPRTSTYTPSNGGGGNSFVFQFNVTGNATPDGAEAMAEKVVQLVERRMNARASMIMRA